MKFISYVFIVLILLPSLVLANNTFDAVLHPVDTAKNTAVKLVAGATIGFITKKIGEASFYDFKIYMEENPEEAEKYLQTKIQFADEFFSYIDKYKSGIEPKDFEDYEKCISTL